MSERKNEGVYRFKSKKKIILGDQIIEMLTAVGRGLRLVNYNAGIL